MEKVVVVACALSPRGFRVKRIATKIAAAEKRLDIFVHKADKAAVNFLVKVLINNFDFFKIVVEKANYIIRVKLGLNIREMFFLRFMIICTSECIVI